ncbi:kinesin-like protein KIF17 [Anopheles maculipalpis]|uniref:kinesin-like protein KIF17 n=1 Tax=Anopheles maculipalpis TaxID=1496333 RepID=UPI00215932B0|nr:kinesin-like protein KIF17 [Anopheles maculipalpis]
MAENVKVVVRCRPMNKREQQSNCKSVIQIDNSLVNLDNPNDTNAPQKSFQFDNAYGYAATTENIYSDICYSLVESVLEGYNATIFAYGQTGCGKSHTMQGTTYNLSAADPNNANNIGIIPRSFEHIFEAISLASEVRYLVLVSYLEIYNETIRDLLQPQNQTAGSLQIKEVPGEGVAVQNLSQHTVHGMRECIELLELGAKNRMVGATLMNIESSRSHSIFSISLEQMSTSVEGEGASIKRGKLNLVDLAGSERQSKTGATGERLKEATKINLSLSALGNVISALVDGKTRHIPYRDSKLTRLLQDSLGGNTKTLMIACISPADYNYDETLSTLRYASRAKNIANKPRVNEDPKDTMLREYQQEIMRLKELLKGGENRSLDINGHQESMSLGVERQALKTQYDQEVMHLRREYEQQKIAKQELVKDIEKIKAYYEQQMQLLTTKQLSDGEKDLTTTAQLANRDRKEIYDRIKQIKDALIGGERANDIQLKEKRYRNKLASEKRINALAQALGRIEQAADRDFLQGHCSDIQQELKVRYEQIRALRKRSKFLEQEVSDIQGEFQRERDDYLATIRLLEKKILFYEAVFQKAMPVLRKDGRYWNLECLEKESEWSDDLRKWRLPDDTLLRLRLPPAETPPPPAPPDDTSPGKLNGRESQTSLTAPGRLERSSTMILAKLPDFQRDNKALTGPDEHQQRHKSDFLSKSTNSNPFPKIEDVAMTYFRPRRAAELVYKSGWRSFQK